MHAIKKNKPPRGGYAESNACGECQTLEKHAKLTMCHIREICKFFRVFLGYACAQSVFVVTVNFIKLF